ncbi:MAG: EamA family transporter [Candidatus Nomurabacteria bacterium]|nr:MAG: EamA family transporter [Candidatus Nomurabacteria bacterium]
MAKTNKKYFWYGFLAMLLGSLNIPLMKYATESTNPATINALRYSFGALVTFPYFFKNIHKLNKNNLRYSVLSGIAIFVSSACLVIALDHSTANYVALLTILSPIMLVLFSLKMTKDKVDIRKIAGFSIALLGALIIIAGPLIKTENASLEFYPLATFFILLIVIAYPLSVIFARKANEERKKLPLTAIIFIQTIVVAILSFIWGISTSQLTLSIGITSSPSIIIPIVYSGIFVTAISRVLNVASYEKTGSAVNGILYYCGVFITLLISIIFLKEPLSIIATLGGVLILVGVVIAEYGLSIKHKIYSKIHIYH